MKEILGALICLFGLALGLYLGIWVCFIGGIVQVVEAVKATPVQALGIALGLLRVACASFVGWLSGLIVFSVGTALMK